MFANIQSCIRRVCVLCLIGLVVASVATVRAGDFKTIKGNWDIKNNTGTSANDFHVTVKHPGGAAVQIGNPNQFYNDGFFGPPQGQRNAAVGSGGPNTDLILNLDWVRTGPGLIDPGNEIHVGYEYKSTNHKPEIIDAYWTASGTRITSGEQPKLPGFTVGSLKLSNHTGAVMTIENLNFLVSPVEIALAAMLPYVLPGFGTLSGLGLFVPTFVIPDGGEVDVTGFLPALPNDNEFLLWQLTSYSSDTPTLISEGMYQFEGSLFPVPEPSTLALTVGMLVIGGYARRRNRCRQG